MPEDDPEFQGLLENDDKALYPDISAELPGLALEIEERDFTPVTDKPEENFRDLAGAALHNVGIDANQRICAALDANNEHRAPAIIEANNDETVYEVTFVLPDAGLPIANDPDANLGNQNNDTIVPTIVADNTDAQNPPSGYPTRAHRSVIGSQPYNAFAPRVAFLQLGTRRAHRSVLEAAQLLQMSKEEQMFATTASSAAPTVDETIHRYDKIMTTTSKEELHVWAYIMTQYNLKPWLCKFGQQGQTAAVKELTQLHLMDTWKPIHAKKLTREEKRKPLSSLLFLKEKRMGNIKGRACINGAPQRSYTPKEDAASPTVSTESTFITASIAAHERLVIRCCNIPSAFVNTNIDEDVIMVLKGDLAEMMIQVAPEVYRKYVAIDKKGTKIFYVKLQKALYGLMRASLLFYRKLRKEFEAWGFTINPYDPCVANKTTDGGKQLTVVWHVDDLMASCEDDFELTKFSCYLAKIYGPKLSMHTGKKHDYLGVDMEFNEDGTLGVSMIKYLKSVINEFPEIIKERAATPAHDKLFVIRDKKEARPLKEDQALAFHHTVAQLLFVATQARQDIQTAVAFLTTRVKSPDEDDWGKLKRVLKYLTGTKYVKLNLSVDNLGMLKWYVDGSHNVHWDCKGHAGAVFKMGKGATTSYSRKVKLNTRSSTKMEL